MKNVDHIYLMTYIDKETKKRCVLELYTLREVIDGIEELALSDAESIELFDAFPIV